jgi:hypothetical protein
MGFLVRAILNLPRISTFGKDPVWVFLKVLQSYNALVLTILDEIGKNYFPFYTCEGKKLYDF